MAPLIEASPRGLYCAAGDFYIDPWKRVDVACITHAHTDHARPGSARYLCAADGVEILRLRVGRKAVIQGTPYGAPLVHNGVRLSFHPAGHVRGSAQVRVEHCGEVWVISGDYKLAADPTCVPFEPVHCHTFITESTFGLPVYRWPAPEVALAEIADWWCQNQAAGRTSVIHAYALGKAQRILASLDESQGPILVHPAAAEFIPAYEAAGARFPAWRIADRESVAGARGRALVIMPPGAGGASWPGRAGAFEAASASGWALVRGMRRRAAARGFVLSDHADWPGLLTAITETGASSIGVTHGYVAALTRYLNETGRHAFPVATRYGDETEEPAAADGAVG